MVDTACGFCVSGDAAGDEAPHHRAVPQRDRRRLRRHHRGGRARGRREGGDVPVDGRLQGGNVGARGGAVPRRGHRHRHPGDGQRRRLRRARQLRPLRAGRRLHRERGGALRSEAVATHDDRRGGRAGGGGPELGERAGGGRRDLAADRHDPRHRHPRGIAPLRLRAGGGRAGAGHRGASLHQRGDGQPVVVPLVELDSRRRAPRGR